MRERLARDATDEYEKIRESLFEGLDATKEKWVSCEKCGRMTRAPVPDVGARVKAITAWLNQGFGMPAQKLEMSIDEFSTRDLSKLDGKERDRLAFLALEFLQQRGVQAQLATAVPELPTAPVLEVVE